MVTVMVTVVERVMIRVRPKKFIEVGVGVVVSARVRVGNRLRVGLLGHNLLGLYTKPKSLRLDNSCQNLGTSSRPQYNNRQDNKHCE